MDYTNEIKKYLVSQSESILVTKESINNYTNEFLKLIESSKKIIYFTGVGKAGLVGQLVAATMTSLGIPSIYLNPSDLMHGSFGHLNHEDLIILLSKSGESIELFNIIPSLKMIGCFLVLVSSSNNNRLSNLVNLKIYLEIPKEDLFLGFAPSNSKISMLAYFDALIETITKNRGFSKENFLRNHPSGLIGKKLNLRLRDVIDLNLSNSVNENNTLLELLLKISDSKTGGVCVVNDENSVLGVITDGDIRRKIISDSSLNPFEVLAKDLMNLSPILGSIDDLAYDTLLKMRQNNISFLPVVDRNGFFLTSINISRLLDEGFND